jgi:short subunit fatty acids transporter
MSRHLLTAIAAILLLVYALFISYSESNWMYFSRAGSLIVVLGIVLEYWPIIIQSDPDKLAMWTTAESHKAKRVALVTVSVGTITWGFGDCLCHIFSQCQ